MTKGFQTKYIDTGSGTKIIVPAKSTRHGTTGIIPNTIILVFYFASIEPNLRNSGQPMVLVTLINAFFLTGLFAFFAYNLFTALWCSFGRETFTIDQSWCSLSKTIFGIGPKRGFDLSSVLSIAPVDLESKEKKPKNLLQAIGIGSGRISITHGEKEYFFGAALDETETQKLLNEIKKYKTF
jgi:hypothetical protein